VVKDEPQNLKNAIRDGYNNLTENYQSLLIGGKLADFTLAVVKDGKQFSVHKAILAAHSPVFAAMFEHDCEEKRKNKVEITDMDLDVCLEMIRFIYSGKVKELNRYAMELLVAANKVMLETLFGLHLSNLVFCLSPVPNSIPQINLRTIHV
jgi:speckle-type POZ protein